MNTSPLFVALGDTWLLASPPGRRLLASLALSVAGSVLVAWGDPGAGLGCHAPSPLTGAALAVGGAFFGSAYMLAGRSVRPRVSNLEYVTPVYGVASIVLAGLALMTRSELLGYPSASWQSILMMALIPQGIGHTLINWSLGHLTSSRVAVFGLLEPLVAAALAWYTLGEPVSSLQVLGGSMVLVGVALSAASDS